MATGTSGTDSGAPPGQKGVRQIPIVCPGHTRPLAELHFCSIHEDDAKQESRTFLVSACHDKMPMMRDGQSGDWIGTWAGHKGAVWSCRLDPHGYLCATASGDFSVKVWDAITGKCLWEFPHKHIVKTCDFSPNATRLATGGHEGILRVYTLTSEQPDQEDPVELVVKPQSDAAKAKKVVITKCNWWNDQVVLVAGNDGLIRFWEVDTQKVQGTLQVDAEVRDMEVSADKKTLTVAAGKKVSFFDLDLFTLIHAYDMPIHFREEGGASLHPSGKKFVAGGSDLWVRVFDFETGTELECNKGHHGPIRCVRYAPDGKTYATGSEDGTIRLWKTDP